MGSRQIAEQAALRLRELFNRDATDFTEPAGPETHHVVFECRRPGPCPSLQSHLHYAFDGTVSAAYRAALVAEFEQSLAEARRAVPAFRMLGDRDRLPTAAWSDGPPARVRVDIHTTGGVKLWAFEDLVRRCFEQSVERCEVVVAEPAAGLAVR